MIRNSNQNFEVLLPIRRSSQFGILKQNRVLKGPGRVVRLCFLGILLPSLLIAVPLYLRYRVYRHQLYPMTITDMRIVDTRISTTWCQRQLLKANSTFNAFLLPETPKISERLEPFSMERHLVLEDDMKEYWGFYLLKGSVVRVSSCVRWPGASLIVIRGHKHLHECAYIGDNSSEEEDETNDDKSDAPANRPDDMRRHRPDVQFLQPGTDSFVHFNKSLIQHSPYSLEEETLDIEGDIQKILDNLQNKTKNAKKGGSKLKFKNNSATFDLNDRKSINILSPPLPSNKNLTGFEEEIDFLLQKFKQTGSKNKDLIEILNKKLKEISPSKMNVEEFSNRERKKRELYVSTAELIKATEEKENVAIEEGLNPDGIADHRGTILEDTRNDMSNSEFWSSFSSSEEALLSCTGLILNLPLTPHHKCTPLLTEEQAKETYLMNTVIYKVPMHGYYFFVFNSENEVQQNYVRVKFDMEKAVYNVSEPLAACSNASETCSLDLKFLSSQKVVLELPLQKNETNFNSDFVAESECEPRSALYAFCVIAVPVVFILFAFT